MPRSDIAKDGASTRFSAENQPTNRGRKEGVPNRSTVLRRWLTAELDVVNPITNNKERGTVEDEVMLALITKARTGDVAAIKEILDTMYGKLSDKMEHSNPDGSPIGQPIADALVKVYGTGRTAPK